MGLPQDGWFWMENPIKMDVIMSFEKKKSRLSSESYLKKKGKKNDFNLD